MKALGYIRTSTSTNVGVDKDSQIRQRLAIEAFAAANGYDVMDEGDFYYDVVTGKDPVVDRPGFSAMLERIAGNGVRTIICESPDRFARDLIVQLTGHDFLKEQGITLIPASAPDFFIEETPTAVLIRQVLGAVAQFEKSNLVAKLKAARDRKARETGKCGGRKSHNELNPALVARAKELAPHRTLRMIAAKLAEEGFVSAAGTAYGPSAIKSMIDG